MLTCIACRSGIGVHCAVSVVYCRLRSTVTRVGIVATSTVRLRRISTLGIFFRSIGVNIRGLRFGVVVIARNGLRATYTGVNITGTRPRVITAARTASPVIVVRVATGAKTIGATCFRSTVCIEIILISCLRPCVVRCIGTGLGSCIVVALRIGLRTSIESGVA